MEGRKKIAVIGAGMFGYPMANYVAEKVEEVCLFDTDKEVIASLRDEKRHPKHFTTIKIHDNVVATSDLEEAIMNARIIITATPSKAYRSAARSIVKVLNRNKDEFFNNRVTYLNLAKGLEPKTNMRLSQVLEDEFSRIKVENYKYKVAVLSGGMIASEFAKGNPLFATIASEDIRVAEVLRGYLGSESLYLDVSDDLIGVELAGPLKNVIAITAGIGEGIHSERSYEASTIGGFISAISKEAEQLAVYMGAKPKTFSLSSKAWGGDIMATCFGKSRNKAFGVDIGRGSSAKKVDGLMDEQALLVEGYHTTKVLYEISEELSRKVLKETGQKIDFPLIRQTYEVLYKNKSPQQAIHELMQLSVRNDR